MSATREVTYSHHPPHPASRGIYGESGTIADFLRQQDVAAFVAAADRYLAALQSLYDAWRAAPPAPAGEEAGSELEAATADLLDLDRGVAGYCRTRGMAEPVDLEARLNLHLAAIAALAENARAASAAVASDS